MLTLNPKNKLILLVACYVLIALFAYPGMHASVYAQTAVNSSEEILLYATPRNPGANENVSLRAENYSIDIDRAEISWYLNGELQKRGIGKNEFIFKTGPIGSSHTIRIGMQTATGAYSETTHTINIAVIDFLWHADTYTPPFYKGKALVTAQSPVTITAQPFLINAQGTRIPPERLVYTWRENGTEMKDESGFGKQTITIEGPRTFQRKIFTLEVSSANRQIKTEGGVVIRAVQPSVVFYEKRPLGGVWYEEALGGVFDLTREELTLRAEPFFFPVKAIRSAENLDIEWSLNNRLFTPQNPFEVILRQVENIQGQAQVSLTIRDSENIQKAVDSLFVDFASVQ